MLALLSSALLLVGFMICGNISQSLLGFHLPKEYINIHHSTGLPVLKGLWMCVSSFTSPHKHLSSKASLALLHSMKVVGLSSFPGICTVPPIQTHLANWLLPDCVFAPLAEWCSNTFLGFPSCSCARRGYTKEHPLCLTKLTICHQLHTTKLSLPKEQLLQSLSINVHVV